MRPDTSKLPWFVELLGKPPSTPELARVVSEFGLLEERSGSVLWFENVDAGISVGCRRGVIETFQYFSAEVDGFTRFAGELPMGLKFENSRDDVVALFGVPDHEIGPRSHGGIMRYDLGRCWIAVVLSSQGRGLESVGLESRDCAARFTGRP